MGIFFKESTDTQGEISLNFNDEIIGFLKPFDISSPELDLRDLLINSKSILDQSALVEFKVQNLKGEWKAESISGNSVFECSLKLENCGENTLNLTRLDTFSFNLLHRNWKVTYFSSDWGDECSAKNISLENGATFGVHSGRSSHGDNPVIYLVREDDGFCIVIAPAWSGNWHIEISKAGSIRAGISPYHLEVPIKPSEKLDAPSVIFSVGSSVLDAREALQISIRDNWIPRSAAIDKAPIEWNHWWPYEDVELNEEIFLANAKIAAEIGVNTVVLDAGWFGKSDLSSNWREHRGDWDLVNGARFPSGLEDLGMKVNKLGVQPGIWLEVEAVGAKSDLRVTSPQVLALNVGGDNSNQSYINRSEGLDKNDPSFLGYVCLGSVEGWQHALDSITRVVTEIGAKWLKIDFNVDPGKGCTRIDHGHSSGDGLFRHYQGLYKLLDTVKKKFPDLLIEACSSGGLRIDLGLAKYVDCFFLSDPDYTEHHLQVLWGASHILPPIAILHWPWSYWRGDYPPSRIAWDEVSIAEFDLIIRAAMLHRFGFSYPLPIFPKRLTERLAYHINVFRESIAPILSHAVLSPLSGPPERGGGGQRISIWVLSSHSNGAQETHLVLGFVLQEKAERLPFEMRFLDSGRHYLITNLENGECQEVLGSEIDSNLIWDISNAASSWIIEIKVRRLIISS